MKKQEYQFQDVETKEIVTFKLSFDELIENTDILRQFNWKGRTYLRHLPESPAARAAVERKSRTPFSKAYNRPLESVAAGVHPSQAAEFNEAARRDGISGVYYNAKGNPEFSSRSARRKELKRRQIHDTDGGYGDG